MEPDSEPMTEGRKASAAERSWSRATATGAEVEAPGAGTAAEADDAERLSQRPLRMLAFALVTFLLMVVVYYALSRIVGISETLDRLANADPAWLALALVFSAASIAGFITAFQAIAGAPAERGRGKPGLSWGEAYQICLAGLAASSLIPAGGAGSIALSYWALRRAGLAARATVCRLTAFLVSVYSLYALALVVAGSLLWAGVLAGEAPTGLTLVPAGLAAFAIVVLLLITLVPADVERQVAKWTGRDRMRWLRRGANGPALLAAGVRTAVGYARDPRHSVRVFVGAIGYWAANIAVLWASFRAYGEHVTIGVLLQGFFVGMAANTIPFLAAGGVDAGMIAAFLAFGEPSATVIVSVFTYRLLSFWLPTPIEVAAYLQLRRTVRRWEQEGAPLGEAAPLAAPR
jgi:putative heme transporter